MFIQDNAPSTKEIVQINLVTPQLVVIQATAVATQMVAYERKNTVTLVRITKVDVKRDTFLMHLSIGHVTIKTLMTELKEIGKVTLKTKVDVHKVQDAHSRIAQATSHHIVHRTVMVSRVAHILHGGF